MAGKDNIIKNGDALAMSLIFGDFIAPLTILLIASLSRASECCGGGSPVPIRATTYKAPPVVADLGLADFGFDIPPSYLADCAKFQSAKEDNGMTNI